jgi:hypothetical protein
MAKEKEATIILHGTVSIESLSEEEQRTFYAAVLVRILTLYREKRKEGS